MCHKPQQTNSLSLSFSLTLFLSLSISLFFSFSGALCLFVEFFKAYIYIFIYIYFTQYGDHFFYYCIHTPMKRFTFLQNKFFIHLIPFLLNRSPIYGYEVVFVMFSKTPHGA